MVLDRIPNIDSLRVSRMRSPVSVLGPGARAVVWVQGCPHKCTGCIAPESWDSCGGTQIAVNHIADWIFTCSGIEGVTFSGGEPMDQAHALSRLVDLLRENTDIGVLCFTGYTLDYLQAQGNESQHRLLARVDLLVDGPYVAELHADLLWRGSSNQRLLALTNRYRSLVDSLTLEADRSAGLEFHVEADGTPMFVGVPPVAGFRDGFENAMCDRGIRLRTE